MNRRFRLILIFIFAIAVPLYLAAQSETITINHVSVFDRLTRSPVLFTHSEHEGLDRVSCTDCHHIYENGKNILDPTEITEGNIFIKCYVCHRTKSELMFAYHKQCIGCHDKAIESGKPAGPRTCGECHVKRAAEK